MKRVSIFLILLNNYITNITLSARILAIFPIPFTSHQFVFHALTEEIARNGHELVVLTPLARKNKVPNITDIEVHDISYQKWEENYNRALEKQNSFTMPAIPFWKHLVYPTMFEVVEAQFSTKHMQELINDQSQHFDLILLEACVRSNYIITARFKAPVIIVSSYFGEVENFQAIGATAHPLLFPDYNTPRTWNLSFWDRISMTYHAMMSRFIGWQVEHIENKLIRKFFGENCPSVRELKKNVQMLWLNVHHIWDNNRPVPPSVVYMGALHLRKPSPLPEDLETYLNLSQKGVIYMSLGSKIKSSDLPKSILQVFLRTFRSLPFDVLWKWNGAIPEELPTNVRLQEWLPQNDLLHHPKIKAFITQGGLQSTDEAIAAKVPLIGLPVISDQWYNAQKYVQHGIGMQLDMESLTVDDLRNAIFTVADNQTYKENLHRLSRIMELQRSDGLQKAVKWVDYIAQYGGDQLRCPTANATFVEFYMLDILAVILTILILIAILSFLTMKMLLTLISKKKVKSLSRKRQ